MLVTTEVSFPPFQQTVQALARKRGREIKNVVEKKQ